VLSCGLALLLVPAVMAIPPYVAPDYLMIGAVCVTAVVVKMLGGRVTDLMKISISCACGPRTGEPRPFLDRRGSTVARGSPSSPRWWPRWWPHRSPLDLAAVVAELAAVPRAMPVVASPKHIAVRAARRMSTSTRNPTPFSTGALAHRLHLAARPGTPDEPLRGVPRTTALPTRRMSPRSTSGTRRG
jgi:hypothetical protein